MTIPRSPTIHLHSDLVHPLIECGYKVPWLDDSEFFWESVIVRTCSICKKILQKDAPMNITYCSVACRQMGKR